MANLYAEYLPNIKTLTITTVLETPRNAITALWLSNDRSKLVLEHDNHTHRITLPAKVSGQGTQHLQLPNTGDLQCVNRISADPIFGHEEPIALWSATHLDQETRVHCKNCSTLVSNDKISVWKDLPSEAWAEMMDLWHCHKPEEPARDSDDATAQKGYAAGNKLMAQVGVGLVDVMSFLVSEHDCTVVYRPLSTDTTIHQAHCKSCATVLGHRDPLTEGTRLQKPYLSLSSAKNPTTHSFSPANWFSSYLSQTIETQGVRKFIFASLPHELWVFSTNLAYSCLEAPKPGRAMKVLFRGREEGKDVEVLRAENLLIETLSLGAGMEELLYQVLKEENEKLPGSLRRFMGWEVAVLPVLYNSSNLQI